MRSRRPRHRGRPNIRIIFVKVFWFWPDMALCLPCWFQDRCVRSRSLPRLFARRETLPSFLHLFRCKRMSYESCIAMEWPMLGAVSTGPSDIWWRLTDDVVLEKKIPPPSGAASMLSPSQITGSGRRQATLTAPLAHHVVADRCFFPHAVTEVLQLGVVAVLAFAGRLSCIDGLRNRGCF